MERDGIGDMKGRGRKRMSGTRRKGREKGRV